MELSSNRWMDREFNTWVENGCGKIRQSIELTLTLFNETISTNPGCIANLPNLKQFSVTDCNINRIPPLPEANHINILFNRCKLHLDECIESPKLEYLGINDSDIECIPESISNLSQLKILHLSNTNITCIADSVFKLTNLKSLVLSYNKIQSIPDGISNLQNLSYLNLENNLIVIIPLSVFKLSSLTQLYLSHNKIQNIPDDISNLKKLTKLGLQFNLIEHIPESISSMENLDYLDMCFNKIKNIPESIYLCPKLKYLHLNDNNITAIPASLFGIKYGHWCFLENNPLTYVPPNIKNIISKTCSIFSGFEFGFVITPVIRSVFAILTPPHNLDEDILSSICSDEDLDEHTIDIVFLYYDLEHHLLKITVLDLLRALWIRVSRSEHFMKFKIHLNENLKMVENERVIYEMDKDRNRKLDTMIGLLVDAFNKSKMIDI